MRAAPASIDALVEAVAHSAPSPLRIAGGGSKRPSNGNGLVVEAGRLDMGSLSGISAYDPAECVVTVLAGTPVADLQQRLAAHGQYLPWDPPGAETGATIGGMIASGLSGPGRYRYGGVRDFVIGARVVDGRGRLITSGGQVVKNAAGFLTHHVLVGSAGRLGVIAGVSLKVFPRPEATCTLVSRPGALTEALAAHERLRQANLDLDALDLDGASGRVLARLAGAADALPARVAHAGLALGPAAELHTGPAESVVWRTLAWTAWLGTGSIVKVPAVPSRLAAILAVLIPLGEARVSVGGAVVYLRPRVALDEADAACRTAGLGGTVVGGPGFGRTLGAALPSPFYDRVARTLDPDARFF